MPCEYRAGTSGFSYKEWRGAFYPEDLAPDEWLGYYARQLPTVEINNTFYRMPRQHVVEAWRDSVPDGFQFVIKASRRITHQKRLKDTDEPMGYLLQRAEILGAKLGALLFQLPPNFRANVDRLRAFQDLLPESLPVAFEFRHDSWLEPEVDMALQARGHARVVSHDGDGTVVELLPNPLCYLRLRDSSYGTRDLKSWRKKIEASGAERALVFFKHEDAGGGPKMAAAFQALDPVAEMAPATPRRAPKRAAGKKAPGQKAAPKRAASRKAARKDSVRQAEAGKTAREKS